MAGCAEIINEDGDIEYVPLDDNGEPAVPDPAEGDQAATVVDNSQE